MYVIGPRFGGDVIFAKWIAVYALPYVAVAWTVPKSTICSVHKIVNMFTLKIPLWLLKDKFWGRFSVFLRIFHPKQSILYSICCFNREHRSLLRKCAATTLSSKLVASQKDFFANMVVEAVSCLDDLLPMDMIGIKKVQGGALEVCCLGF